jgi:hypothetical protein
VRRNLTARAFNLIEQPGIFIKLQSDASFLGLLCPLTFWFQNDLGAKRIVGHRP